MVEKDNFTVEPWIPPEKLECPNCSLEAIINEDLCKKNEALVKALEEIRDGVEDPDSEEFPVMQHQFKLGQAALKAIARKALQPK